MRSMSSGMLRVPGASLHFELRGSGPVLLLVHGSIADSGIFGPLAGLLAERYTVVTYDRRGYVRSPLDGEAAPMAVAEQSEDARLILDEVGAETALVLGSSGGALIALDLLARHPQRVTGLLAHEPPVLTLLPEGEELIAFIEDLRNSEKSGGAHGAGEALLAKLLPAVQQDPEFEPGFTWDGQFPERMEANQEYWFLHEVGPGFAYDPDVAALRDVSDKLVLAVGEDSADWPAARSTVLLGAQTGGTVIPFPGGHTGFLVKPRAFQEKLIEVLADREW